MSKRYGSVQDRFWREVWPEPMSGCWLWSGAMDDHGYGRFRIGGRKKRMHQVSYEMHKGPVPIGLVVRHTCDNRLCVNPDHLITGTQADNVADRDARKRTAVGTMKSNAVLTEQVIAAIRMDKRPHRKIAAHYGLSSHSTIGRIKRGEDWKHVP